MDSKRGEGMGKETRKCVAGCGEWVVGEGPYPQMCRTHANQLIAAALSEVGARQESSAPSPVAETVREEHAPSPIDQPQDDDLVCFIDSCINCGDVARHRLRTDDVKWTGDGDATCPECGYDRGVYSATACCVKEADAQPAPLGPHDTTHPADMCDEPGCDHITRRTCEGAEKLNKFLRETLRKRTDRLAKADPAWAEQAAKNLFRSLYGDELEEELFPESSALGADAAATRGSSGSPTGNHFSVGEREVRDSAASHPKARDAAPSLQATREVNAPSYDPCWQVPVEKSSEPVGVYCLACKWVRSYGESRVCPAATTSDATHRWSDEWTIVRRLQPLPESEPEQSRKPTPAMWQAATAASESVRRDLETVRAADNDEPVAPEPTCMTHVYDQCNETCALICGCGHMNRRHDTGGWCHDCGKWCASTAPSPASSDGLTVHGEKFAECPHCCGPMMSGSSILHCSHCGQDVNLVDVYRQRARNAETSIASLSATIRQHEETIAALKRWPTDTADWLGLTGDDLGGLRYCFIDKPHRFIKGLMDERDAAVQSLADRDRTIAEQAAQIEGQRAQVDDCEKHCHTNLSAALYEAREDVRERDATIAEQRATIERRNSAIDQLWKKNGELYAENERLTRELAGAKNLSAAQSIILGGAISHLSEPNAANNAIARLQVEKETAEERIASLLSTIRWAVERCEAARNVPCATANIDDFTPGDNRALGRMRFADELLPPLRQSLEGKVES